MKILIIAVAFTLVASMAIGQQPTWTDPATGLMWTSRDNGDDVTNQEASNYCQNLSLGGYSGWRLPTINELKSIYNESLKWHIKDNIQMTEWLWVWSSTSGDASEEGSVFFFLTGERFSLPLRGSAGKRALCVRRTGQ
ncbi:MAG TPA: DUF1566 domain-containing protein [Terracidiphilus sp.]|jgi:hypothetical protein